MAGHQGLARQRMGAIDGRQGLPGIGHVAETGLGLVLQHQPPRDRAGIGLRSRQIGQAEELRRHLAADRIDQARAHQSHRRFAGPAGNPISVPEAQSASAPRGRRPPDAGPACRRAARPADSPLLPTAFRLVGHSSWITRRPPGLRATQDALFRERRPERRGARLQHVHQRHLAQLPAQPAHARLQRRGRIRLRGRARRERGQHAVGQRQLLRRRSQRGAPIAHQHGTQQRASRQVVALHADLAVHHQQMPPADGGEFAPRHRQRLVGQGRQAGTRAVAAYSRQDARAGRRPDRCPASSACRPDSAPPLHRRGPALRPQDGRGQQLPTPRAGSTAGVSPAEDHSDAGSPPRFRV